MAEFLIRPYKACDFEPVLSLWNRCLKRDPISKREFQIKILNDENFSESGAFVAEAGGNVIGFLLAIFRRVPLSGVGMQENTGWITTFFVDETYRGQGVGTALFEKAEKYLKGHGKTQVVVSSYVPNYFIPGMDVDSYKEAFNLLNSRGYKTLIEQFGMSVDLLDFEPIPKYYLSLRDLADEGIQITYLEHKYTHKLLSFLETEFPGDWAYVIRNRIRSHCDLNDIVIAIKGDEVVGYCQVDGEHFGPFGVHSTLRGKGVGTVLITKAMLCAKEKGIRHLWLAWTGAVEFYSQIAGFKVIRKHKIMKKELEE